MSGRALVGLVLGLVALPAVYVISTVPVIWLTLEGYLPMWVQNIYSPIHLVPPVRDFVTWLLNQMP